MINKNNHQEIKVELNGITKTLRLDLFSKTRFNLGPISCSFLPGEISVILGYNGAGKTTLLKIIMGLIKTDSGSVLINERLSNNASRKYIGYMPEVHKLQSSLRVKESLLYSLKLYHNNFIASEEQKKRVDKYLTDMDLQDYSTRKINTLSKGQKRRVSWIQSILHGPQVLILDEPFEGLDVEGRKKLLNLILDAKKNKNSIKERNK